jgi:hypothetical protein
VRPLTVSAAGQDKVYDGTLSAAVNLSDDRIMGDDLHTSYTSASFADKHAGNNKAVSVAGIALTGTDAANYSFNSTAGTTARITALALGVSAVTDSKVYDGTTASSVSPTISSGSLAAGDIAGFTQSFDTPNAGTGKTLNASGSVIDGNGGNNYTVSFATVTNGLISPASLTITANNKSRTYGLANPPLTAHYTGFVSGENTNVLSGAPLLSTSATQSSPPDTYPITISVGTLIDANYNFSFVDGTLTVSQPLQITGTLYSQSQFSFTFATVTGQKYQVEYSDSPGSGTWIPSGDPIIGTGDSVSITNGVASPQRFFRLNIQP